MSWKSNLLIFLMFSSKGAYAEVDVRTAGLRFGALVAQAMLASPPLPSLDSDNKQHISMQLAYVTGKLNYYYGPLTDPNGGSYKGKPKAYGLGFGYTSRASGRLNYFGFGLYTQATADIDYDIPVGGPVGMRSFDSKIGSGALAVGGNQLLYGSLSSPYTAAMFGGAMIFINRTTYMLDMPAFGGDPGDIFKVEGSSTTFGPMLGLQFKVRMGALSIIPYTFHFLDVTNHCVTLKYRGLTESCGVDMNGSFTAAGAMLGLYKFRFTAYTKTWSSLDTDDTKLQNYHLSYSIDI